MADEGNIADKMWDHEIPQEWRDFKYAAGHSITHSNREILIQFFNPRPLDKPIVVSRIVLNPEHAQELILNLGNQLRKWKDARGLPPER